MKPRLCQIQTTKDARQRVLDLTERRFSRGLSTALEVRTARTQLAGAEAQIASQQLLKANAARRLEVLLARRVHNSQVDRHCWLRRESERKVKEEERSLSVAVTIFHSVRT